MWKDLGKKEKYVIYASGFLLFLTLVLYKNIFAAPNDFAPHTLITVSEGETLSQIVDSFEREKIVQSGAMLRNIIILIHGETSVMAGDYFFENRENILKVARRITRGEFGLEPERVTIAEGANIMEIAKIFGDRFPKFDPEEFLVIAEEGYMFPDTYFFLPNVDASQVAKKLRSTFDIRISTLADEIEKTERTLPDLIKMASIIEKEARDYDDRRMISGILWSRFDDDYPLQVDVAFQYINGKNTYQLTMADLATTSPYNTYVHSGLPPTPIANPGLESIKAALDPVLSDYYFFLSDRSGKFYYSKTFAEHSRKQDLYVR